MAAGAPALKNPSVQGLSAQHRPSHFLIGVPGGSSCSGCCLRRGVRVQQHLLGSAAPMRSLCPSQALLVSGLLLGLSHNEPCAHSEHVRWCLVSFGFPTGENFAFGREMLLYFCKSCPNTLKEEFFALEKVFISL